MMTAGGLIYARVYLAELVAILQSQLSQHGNDTIRSADYAKAVH